VEITIDLKVVIGRKGGGGSIYLGLFFCMVRKPYGKIILRRSKIA
jgi:hypothetical protein